MKEIKEKNKNKPVLLTKIICYSMIALAAIVGFIVIPKVLLSPQQTYTIANSLADINEDTMVFYDYQVYATETKFKNGLENDVGTKLQSFKERGELMLVRIPGESKTLNNQGEYWLETNPEVLDLNIEYYLIPNVTFAGNSLPARTVVTLVNDV